jgi:endoglucanase
MAIVDSTNRRVKLTGGNWSGGHALRHCVGGLDYQPISKLCEDIRGNFGMNCVRLTFSLELFKKKNIVPENLIRHNPQFFGMNCVQIFQHTVKALTDSGLMVILNNHTSKSQWCCTPFDGDGLWFNN